MFFIFVKREVNATNFVLDSVFIDFELMHHIRIRFMCELDAIDYITSDYYNV